MFLFHGGPDDVRSMDSILMAKLLGLVEPFSSHIPQLAPVTDSPLEVPEYRNVRGKWIWTLFPNISMNKLRIEFSVFYKNLPQDNQGIKPLLCCKQNVQRNSLDTLLLSLLQLSISSQNSQDGLLLLFRQETQVDHNIEFLSCFIQFFFSSCWTPCSVLPILVSGLHRQGEQCCPSGNVCVYSLAGVVLCSHLWPVWI